MPLLHIIISSWILISRDAGDPTTTTCPAATWRQAGAGTQLHSPSHVGGLPAGKGDGEGAALRTHSGMARSLLVSPTAASRLSSVSGGTAVCLLHPSPCCNQAGVLSQLLLPHWQEEIPSPASCSCGVLRERLGPCPKGSDTSLTMGKPNKKRR